MNDLRERSERLLAEEWLDRDVDLVQQLATRIRARHRRAVTAGVVALAVLLIGSGVVLLRPDRPSGPSSLDVGDVPAPVYDPTDVTKVVYFSPDLTADEQLAVRAELVGDPDVGQAWWSSQESAYALFACLFVDQPQMIESVTPSILPMSAAVAFADGADPDAFESRMRATGTVTEVVTVAGAGGGSSAAPSASYPRSELGSCPDVPPDELLK